LYNSKKKKTRLKGMNEFLEAESEASQKEAVAMPEPNEEIVEGDFE